MIKYISKLRENRERLKELRNQGYEISKGIFSIGSVNETMAHDENLYGIQHERVGKYNAIRRVSF